MRRSDHLPTLYGRVRARLVRLELLAARLPYLDEFERSRLTTYLSIEGLSAWETFCREYFLSCVLLNARDGAGATITHARTGRHLSERRVLLLAIWASGNASFRPKGGRPIQPRDEPDWKSPGIMKRLAGKLAFSNRAKIDNAFGVRTTAFSHFFMVRNFYAHKDEVTANKIKRLAKTEYLIPRLGHPTSLVSTILPSQTDTLMAQWLADIREVAKLMCA
jgi:hypothetical protein